MSVITLPHLMMMFVPYATNLFKEFPSYKERVEALINDLKQELMKR